MSTIPQPLNLTITLTVTLLTTNNVAFRQMQRETDYGRGRYMQAYGGQKGAE